MQANLTHHSPTRKSIEVVVPATEVSDAFGNAIAKLAPKAKVPGFRPGKAPKNILMSRYEGEIKAEVVDGLLSRHFFAAAKSTGVQPISRPSLEAVELQDGQEGRLKAQFDVAPEVTVPDYKGLSAAKQKRIVDDAAVEEQLETLRQRAARYLPVEEPAADGFFATVDVKVKPQGLKVTEYKDQVVQLLDGRPFDKEILGMKVDEEKTFAVAIPEEDAPKALAGKSVNYEVKLKDLRKREIPALDDDFAKDMGDYADLAAFRAFVKQDLEQASEREAEARLHNALLDQLLASASFEVPASMVALQLDDYCREFAEMVARQGADPRKMNWASFRQSRLAEAERAVRTGYLLQAIGNAESIDVSDEDVEKEIRSLMEEHKIQQPFETFKEDLDKRGASTEIRGRLRTDRILALIATSAVVKEELLDKAAFEALLEAERRQEADVPAARFDAGGVESGEDAAESEA